MGISYNAVVIALLAISLAADPQPQHVVGGDRASAGDWPDAAALLGSQDRFLCTGVLIAPQAVLTAGHCDIGIERVVLDSVDYTQPTEVIEVTRTITHPDPLTTFDVSIAVLAQPAQTAPRPLAIGCQAEWLFDGATVTIAGFGATNEFATDWAEFLQAATTIVTDADCSESSRGCIAAARPEGELIAGGDGIDSCNGDSGGPLYLDTPDGPVLVGVTSRGALPSSRPCGGGGIYVRVDAILDWLADEADLTFAEPTCSSVPNLPPELAVAPVTVPAGGAAGLSIATWDPDGDEISVDVAVSPARGSVTFEEGVWRYAAPADALGTDAFIVRATDNGVPVRSVEFEVDVVVTEAEEPGGCQHVPASTFWWAVLLLFYRNSHTRPSA